MRHPEVAMASAILLGTDDGLRTVGDDAGRAELDGHRVVHLAARGEELWAVVDRDLVMHRSADGKWTELARLPERAATCVLPGPWEPTPTSGAEALVGTSEAHLYRLRNGSAERLESFERVEGREDWFTPWGGPPATRSLTADREGTIYANVHVGGILRSADGGESWDPTVEIRADVHEVRVDPRRDELLAAAAIGFGVSEDGGSSWRFTDDGLRASYARAVAVTGETVFLTASEGPRGGRAAIYRRNLAAGGSFERCREGLPEWFDRNLDTHCLDAGDGLVAFGTSDGSVFVSQDDGSSWEPAAQGLPSVNSLLISSG
jgi:hypothetical protein